MLRMQLLAFPASQGIITVTIVLTACLPSSGKVRKKLHGIVFFCHNPGVVTDCVT